MQLLNWIRTKILGFDPTVYKQELEDKLAKYEETYEILLDGIIHQVTEISSLTDNLKVNLEKVDDIPGTEWHAAVQNAIQILDTRLEEMSDYVDNHEEYFEHIFAEDDSVTLTAWGLIENKKQSN